MSRSIILRAGPLSARARVRPLIVCAVLVVVAAVLATAALLLGTYPISLSDVRDVVVGSAVGPVMKVVAEWRAPRIGGALLLGAALGVSGAVFQSLTRNPLGSPDVIGFTTGAYTGVVAAMLLGATSYAALVAGALGGGLATAVVVYALAFRGGLQGFRLIIVGIAVSAFLGSLNTWFLVKVPVDEAMRAAVWGAGTLALVDGTVLSFAAPVLAAIAVCLPVAQQRLRRLELGDETAAVLGVRVERTKALLVLLAVAAVAVATAAAGPIAFVALAAPQIARRLTGSSVDLPGAALVGAVTLLGADMVAQHAVPGAQLPTGAVTVCVGGVYLLVLLAREGRRRTRVKA